VRALLILASQDRRSVKGGVCALHIRPFLGSRCLVCHQLSLSAISAPACLRRASAFTRSGYATVRDSQSATRWPAVPSTSPQVRQPTRRSRSPTVASRTTRLSCHEERATVVLPVAPFLRCGCGHAHGCFLASNLRPSMPWATPLEREAHRKRPIQVAGWHGRGNRAIRTAYSRDVVDVLLIPLLPLCEAFSAF